MTMTMSKHKPDYIIYDSCNFKLSGAVSVFIITKNLSENIFADLGNISR